MVHSLTVIKCAISPDILRYAFRVSSTELLCALRYIFTFFSCSIPMKCPLTQRPLAFPCPGLYRVFPRTFPGAFPYTLAFFIPLSFIYPCVFMCFSLHSSIRNSVRCALTYRWASCHFFCLIFHAIRRSTLRSLIYPLQCFYRAFSHLFPVRSAMCPGWFLPKFSFHPWRFSLCMCTSV